MNVADISDQRVSSFLQTVKHICSDEITNYYLGLVSPSEAVIVKTLSLGAFHSNPHLGRLLRQRFARKIERETKKFLIMDHPAIVTVHWELHMLNRNIAAVSSQPFGNLMNWIGERTVLSVHAVCLVMQQVFRGLAYMHQIDQAHGNLKMSNIVFRTDQPDSACIVLDSSVKSELLKLCSPIPMELIYCPPELQSNMVQLLVNWSTVVEEIRNDEELAEVDRMLTATPERDVWCAGVILHILLTGIGPFDADQLEEQLVQFRYPTIKCTHPMFHTLSPRLVHQLEQFLHSDPQVRAKALDGAGTDWFSDRMTIDDERNILYLNEENFLRLFMHMNVTNFFRRGSLTELFKQYPKGFV